MSNTSPWLRPSAELKLAEDEVHVWRAQLDLAPTALRRLESTLAIDEDSRAARFLFARDREHFIAARGILRELLGAYLNRSAAELGFDYRPQGKPSLRVGETESTLRFNLSHSHGYAVFAFARNRELGIDLESIRPGFAGEEIAKRYFSKQELTEMRALPPGLRAEGFFLCWTRKEAYVKARGGGLQIPLDSFHVSLTPGQPEKLQSADANRWSLHSFEPAPRFVGAIVTEGKIFRLRFWDWKPRSEAMP
jgi:4'-phosphopantetheinyl transferase